MAKTNREVSTSTVPSFRALVQRQRAFFQSGNTLPYAFRRDQLEHLRRGIKAREGAILDALKTDLGKHRLEGFGSEIGLCYEELRFTLRHLEKWMQPKRVSSVLPILPARSYIHAEPLGVVLILAPWNYPFQLVLAPLIGAIAAGNCAIVKPSELAPATSALLADLVNEEFPSEYIAAVEGGVAESQALLQEHFDHIFFTGGTAVGRTVMQAAALHLTPVTLELGGKSPAIVDADTDLDRTAKRLTWGKFFNAGQTCVAPDYLLVHQSVKEPLLERMKFWMKSFFGEDPAQSSSFGRIINDRHVQRLKGYLEHGRIVAGGFVRENERYVAPTIIDNVPWTTPVMQEEIFGPILPVVKYEHLEDAIALVQERPKPLACYIFTKNKKMADRVLNEVSFGGGCVNDVLIHLSNPHLPFGGVGPSGMGAYHGRFGFDTFSHRKAVVRQSFLVEMDIRYPPYREELLKVFRWIQR